MRDKTDAGWRRPVKEVNVQIGERCRKAREAAGYTQERLAEMANISTRTLGGIEIGKNFMTAETMEKIIKCLDISLAELFDAEYLQPTKTLVEDLHEMINSIKDDSDKVKEVYKVVKALIAI